MHNSAAVGFQLSDWLVLGAYFIVLIITGWLFTRRQRNTDDYFRAGGRIPMFAAAVSLLATSLSAATFIGGPQQAYTEDLTYLSANIGSIIAIVVVALFFIPAYYRNNVATVYGFLARRFGTKSSMAASGAFLIGRVFASGARIYIAALPASLIVFGDIKANHLVISIAVLSFVAIAYTLAGGIRSVIWTDVIQTCVFVGTAIIALVVLLHKIPLTLPEIIEALRYPGEGLSSKLTTLKLGFSDFSAKENFTILTAIFGFTLLNLGSYGTDQDMAQRMLTCRNARKGSQSAVTAIIIGLPVTALFMIIGLLLYIFYSRPDLMGAAAPIEQVEGSRQVFLQFILSQMPTGMTGLMMAGLFAAGLSSLNSALNAMSSVLISDFYKKIRPERSEHHYLFVSRIGVIACGVVLPLFAVFSVFWQQAQPETTLIDFALRVMVFAYSGLVAVYLTAMFTRRGNNTTVIAALVTGFIVVILLQTCLIEKLAFPWFMLIATSVAFGVCCLGKSDSTRAAGI